MTRSSKHLMVMVTVPDLKTGRRLAQLALAQRVAACVNLLPRIESHYWWQGKCEKGTEVLLILKTSATRVRALQRCLLAHHPYQVPEFIVLPIIAGSTAYLQWLDKSIRRAPRRNARSHH